MDPDVVTRLIAASSLCTALAALGWSIASWRLAGPNLRYHCLWYDDALVIRVFNAGRTPDTVEQMELGSTHRTPLTALLELPLRVEPGQSAKWVIGREHLGASRVEALASGWSSLWTLSGSMKQRRAEVVPTGDTTPPASGWRLVPRREKLARYFPFMAAVWAFVATEPGFGVGTAAGGIACVVLAMWAWARYMGVLKPTAFSRAAWQRRLTLLGLLLAVVGPLVVERGSASHAAETVPLWITVSLIVLFGLAVLVARAKLGDWWLIWRRWSIRTVVGPDAVRLHALRSFVLDGYAQATTALGRSRRAGTGHPQGGLSEPTPDHDSSPSHPRGGSEPDSGRDRMSSRAGAPPSPPRPRP